MTITNWKEIKKNTLVGAFDLALDSGFMIQGAMLMGNDKGQWISFPGIPQYKDGQPILKDGKQQYKNILSIPDRDRRDRFNDLVISELKAKGHIS